MKPTRRRALVASIIFLLLGLYSARPIPALANISSDFRQCANMDSSLGDCHWINSVLQGSKSKYIEGMSVPQRLILTDISGASGTTHTLHFHVDATKGGLHAYDWLTSWDQARVAAIQGGIPYNDLFGQTCNAEFDGVLAACQSLAASANHVDVDVPDDAFVSKDGATQPHITAYETAFGNRTVEIFGDASITGGMLTLSHTVPDQGDTGDSTINYSLSWTSASTQIMIELAGHLALGPKVGGIGWGQGLGAGSIPGGPFHISLDDLDGSSLGSQDNQIQPGSGVVVPPQLIVIKHVVGGPNIASDFQITVTATNPSPATFPGAEAPGTTVTLGVGSYSVEEQNLTGYTESKSADCSGSIDAGQTKTCTITNTFKATTSLSTTPNPSTATVGDTLKDSATLSGGFNPTGSITFKLYSDAACTKLTYTDVVTVNGNGTYNTDSAGTPSGGNVSNAAGTWSWTADYSGDQFNSASSSKCGDEPVTVNKANPTIATTQDPASATVGATLSDKATLSGGFNPTGTITFTLYSDTACTKSVFSAAVSVNGAGSYAPPSGFASQAAGTYEWVASYSGDGNNNAASTKCGDEPVTVGPASPGIKTSPNPSSATVGATLNDSAALGGGFNPTGSITFNLYSDAACTKLAYTDVVTINGNGTYNTDSAGTPSGGNVSNSAGTWSWTADYSGDGNNKAASSGCGAEPVIVNKTNPGIKTTQNPASAFFGTTLSDSATLSGGFNPTGTIVFKLYALTDPTCASAPIFTSNPATVNGNGTYASPNGFVSQLIAGTYHWIAFYSGDGNNNAVHSNCADEPVVNTFPPVQPLTPGYWKNHKAQTTALLPISLGTFSVGDFTTATAVFNAMNCGTSTDQGAIGCLAGHLLATELNLKNGSSACISATVAAANSFLSGGSVNGVPGITYIGPSGIYKLTSAQRAIAISLKTAMDNYNNGLSCTNFP